MNILDADCFCSGLKCTIHVTQRVEWYEYETFYCIQCKCVIMCEPNKKADVMN